MLSDGWVPKSDIFGHVSDTEQSVAGAQNLNSMAVAHQRVSELDRIVQEVELNGVEHGVLLENEGEVGAGSDGVLEVEMDKDRTIKQMAP